MRNNRITYLLTDDRQTDGRTERLTYVSSEYWSRPAVSVK